MKRLVVLVVSALFTAVALMGCGGGGDGGGDSGGSERGFVRSVV